MKIINSNILEIVFTKISKTENNNKFGKFSYSSEDILKKIKIFGIEKKSENIKIISTVISYINK